MKQTALIVRSYLKALDIDQGRFADELSAPLRPHQVFAHNTVSTWMTGSFAPSYCWMLLLHRITHPSDWRHAFAAEILSAERPDIYPVPPP